MDSIINTAGAALFVVPSVCLILVGISTYRAPRDIGFDFARTGIVKSLKVSVSNRPPSV